MGTPVFVLHKKTFKMKLLLIFALVFATSSVTVNADIQDGILTIFNGFGNVLEDIGDFLQDPQKIKDAAKRVVGTLKHLGKTAKDGFENLLEDNPKVIQKLEEAKGWSEAQLQRAMADDNAFAKAYAFIKEDIVENEKIQNGFFTILNGAGNVLDNVGNWLQDKEKVKAFAHNFVDTLKHVGRETKEQLEQLLEDKPEVMVKLDKFQKGQLTKEKLQQELDDDADFATAYALINEGQQGSPAPLTLSAPAPATLGLSGFLVMSLFLLF